MQLLLIVVIFTVFGSHLTTAHSIALDIADFEEELFQSGLIQRIRRGTGWYKGKLINTDCQLATNLGGGVAGGGAAGAAAGAGIGAAAGSVVPVLGTAVGALVGGAVGFFTGVGVGTGVTTQVVVEEKCALSLDEFIPNRDLEIIEDDDKDTILKEIKKKNTNFDTSHLEIKEKNEVGATILATKPSLYKTDTTVYVKFLIRRNLYDTNELLRSWSSHYNKTLTEIEREFNQDFKEFNDAQRRLFIDDTNFKLRSLLHDLEQNIIIVREDQYIKKLYNRVVSLENDLAKLKEYIEKSKDSGDCKKVSVYFDAAKGATDAFDKVKKSFKTVEDFLPKSAEYVPVVGYAFQAFSVLNSIQCFIGNL